MTGEITLRGKVLPIGGLKEKSLAARRVGIKTVLIPEGNRRDVDELPNVLKTDVRFMPVQNVSEVFELVLEGGSAFEQPSLELLPKTGKPKTPRKKRAPKPQPLPAFPENGQQDGVRC